MHHDEPSELPSPEDRQHHRSIEELVISEARLRLLVDSVRDHALVTLDAEGRIASWNEGAERTVGYAAAEVLGKPYEVFFSDNDRVQGVPARLLAAALREGRVESLGWRLRKDGTRFMAHATLTALRSPSGELRGFAKVTHDVTELERAADLRRRVMLERMGREAAEAAEQRARAGEERLRRLQGVTVALSGALTVASVASVVLDQMLSALAADGGAVYVVEGDVMSLIAQRAHPSEELAPFERMPLSARAPLTDAARERKALFYRSRKECAERYPELRHIVGAGGFEAGVALPLIVNGSVLGVLGIRFLEERTFEESECALLFTVAELCAQSLERTRLLSAESAARAAAESANRAKDEFLAMLGHELRNPLAPIVTALDVMRSRDDGALRREREVIERQVRHLTRLVDDLLDVARVTRGTVELKRELVELAHVVDRAVELSSPLFEQRRQHLTLEVPATGLVLLGDPTRLAQIVSNLLTNAAKYSAPGGHVRVAASLVGDRISLTVTDEGIGIDPSMLGRVFEPFEREQQASAVSQGGLGLGLAIVKTLVAMHDGTVSAASRGHGLGSVFTVDLPAVVGAPPCSSFAGATSRRGDGEERRRVLVVDDNTDAAEMLADWLEARGHEVETAFHGVAALSALARFDADIVLLDIGLPAMDGFEVARRITELSGDRPPPLLVAVTGYGQGGDRERTREAGFFAHLVKPIDMDALGRLVAEAPRRAAAP